MLFLKQPHKWIALAFGFLCHTAFIVGIGMMMICMYFGMQTSFGSFKSPWSYIINGMLLMQFPLLHSYLLNKKGRSILHILSPEKYKVELTTTMFVIIASIQTILLFSLWTPSGIVLWTSEGAARFSLTLIYIFGWILLLKSFTDASFALHTGYLGWNAVWKKEKAVYPDMPTKGMFRLCRQPIYFSFAVILWSVPIWTLDQLCVSIVLTLYCLIGPLLKEKRFLKIYGKQFNEYQHSLPYWFPLGKSFRFSKQPIILNHSIFYDDAKEWWTGKRRWLRIMQNLIKPRMTFFDRLGIEYQNKRILDIGCGGGFMSEELAKRGAIVTGVDASLPAIEIARDHASKSLLSIEYKIGIAEKLPVSSHSYDYVIIVDVLEHVNDISCVLNEIRRVLKPGGLILFDTINRTPIASFFYIWLGERILKMVPKATHHAKRFIKPNELIELLQKHQFKIGTIQGIGPVGLNSKLDVKFGLILTTAILYIGYASLVNRQENGVKCYRTERTGSSVIVLINIFSFDVV